VGDLEAAGAVAGHRLPGRPRVGRAKRVVRDRASGAALVRERGGEVAFAYVAAGEDTAVRFEHPGIGGVALDGEQAPAVDSGGT